MDLAPSADQTAVLDVVDSLVQRFRDVPAGFHGFHLYSADLDRALDEGGFLDVAAVPELGPVTAVLLVERICALPFCVEIAASAVVRASLLPDLPRPLCLVEQSRERAPVRFLPKAQTILMIDGEKVLHLPVQDTEMEAISSLYAYPMGRLRTGGSSGTRGKPLDIDARVLRLWWRVSLAAEIAGLLQGAIDATIRHVSEREQFGRPIGTFQAVRHRLAEAHVRISGTRLLARKAADTGDAGDAALACMEAQDSAIAVLYDFHQFLGAMGITLEHPLHLWTYRLKALLSELGGRGRQAGSTAAALG